MNIFNKIRIFSNLLRPVNVLIVAFAVIVGGMLCGAKLSAVYIAAISAAFILAAGNVFNDVFDADADRISHPKRPLAAGEIGKGAAIALSIAFFAAGIILAFFASTTHLIFAGAASVLLILYSLYFSRLPLVGNIIIAALAGAAILYGAVFTGFCEKNIFAAILAFSLHLPREIFKDIQDIAGDRAAGRKTLPIAVGIKRSAVLAVALSVLAMIVIEIPFLSRIFGEYYDGVASISFILCGMAAIFGFRGFSKTAQNLLKYAMAAGILALFVEAITG